MIRSRGVRAVVSLVGCAMHTFSVCAHGILRRPCRCHTTTWPPCSWLCQSYARWPELSCHRPGLQLPELTRLWSAYSYRPRCLIGQGLSTKIRTKFSEISLQLPHCRVVRARFTDDVCGNASSVITSHFGGFSGSNSDGFGTYGSIRFSISLSDLFARRISLFFFWFILHSRST